MKFKFLVLCAAGAISMACASNVSAQMYVNGEAGVSLLQDLGIHVYGIRESARFTPGIRGGISVGYNFSDRFAAELQTAAIWNTVDTINGSPPSDNGVTIDLYQFPVLANLIYKTPVKRGFSGYLGAGAGGVATIFDAADFSGDSSDSDFTFAYQGMAGVKYQVASNVDVGIGYRFLGTLDHHWTVTGTGLSTTALYTHSIMATFTLKF